MTAFNNPIIGLDVGISLICFRRHVALFLEKTYEKFPHFKMGKDISFKVRPIFIVAIGITINLFSMLALVAMCNGE